jgi:hypothetical protein
MPLQYNVLQLMFHIQSSDTIKIANDNISLINPLNNFFVMFLLLSPRDFLFLRPFGGKD